MDNPEKLAIYGTQDTRRRQNKAETQDNMRKHTQITYIRYGSYYNKKTDSYL